MADGKNIDILVFDDQFDLHCIQLLKDKGYSVDLISNPKEHMKICETKARVILLGQELDFAMKGVGFANAIRSFDDKKYYIHVFSNDADKEYPAASTYSWKELMNSHTIDSYSNRDPDNFKLYLKNIEDALRN